MSNMVVCMFPWRVAQTCVESRIWVPHVSGLHVGLCFKVRSRTLCFSTVPVFNLFLRARGPASYALENSHLHQTRSSDQLPGRTPRRNLVYEVLKSPHWMQQYQNQGSAHSVPVSSLLQTVIRSVFATLQFCRPSVFMVLRIAFPATPLF